MTGFRSIVLLCGGLQEIEDGVGDHCRLLAGEFVRLGRECFLMSLNDRKVDSVVETSIASNGISIPLVRLPHAIPVFQRLKIAARFLSQWRPDIVSLQFVCYGFHEKGLAWREWFWLPALLAPYRSTLMLHELWLGFGSFRSIKYSIVGAVQRLVVLELVRRIRPAVIFTTNGYYRGILAKNKIAARILPLFGHIPVTSRSAPWLAETIFRECGIDILSERRDHWLFGLFGEVFEIWPAAEVIEKIAILSKKHGKRPLVIFVGRSQRAAAFVRRLKEQFREIAFIALGSRTEVEISEFFNGVDFGLTSYPFEFLGKSGTVAAMVEHGLPVICNWGDPSGETKWLHEEFRKLIIWARGADFESRLTGVSAIRNRFADTLSRVVTMYIDDMDSMQRRISKPS
jgi:hypothetical protein